MKVQKLKSGVAQLLVASIVCWVIGVLCLIWQYNVAAADIVWGSLSFIRGSGSSDFQTFYSRLSVAHLSAPAAFLVSAVVFGWIVQNVLSVKFGWRQRFGVFIVCIVFAASVVMVVYTGSVVEFIRDSLYHEVVQLRLVNVWFLPLILCLVANFIAFYFAMAYSRRWRSSRSMGVCSACGYLLADAERCPECGLISEVDTSLRED